jgi:HEAT repeat protein
MRFLLPVLLIFTICLGCAPKTSKKLEYRGKSLQYWEDQAEDKDPAKRREAAKALGKIGPKGLYSLSKMVAGDKQHRVRAAAYLAAMDIKGEKVVPELKDLIGESDKNVKAGASKLLVQTLVNQGGKKGVQELIDLVKGQDPEVRVQAIRAFLRVNRSLVGPAIPALKKAKRDENPEVSKAASLTLNIIKPPASRSQGIKGKKK